jgi:hypothetical protein
MVGLLGYKIEYGGKAGASTSINLGYIGEQSSSFTYVYGGDLNRKNDLLFVPKKAVIFVLFHISKFRWFFNRSLY